MHVPELITITGTLGAKMLVFQKKDLKNNTFDFCNNIIFFISFEEIIVS